MPNVSALLFMWPTIRLRIQPVRQPKTNVINDCHVSAGRAVVSVPYESRCPVKVSKYYGRIFSRPVNFDIALYDQRIWHVIRAIYFNDSANSGNVALAEVKGIESDGSVFPLTGCKLASRARTDAQYTNLIATNSVGQKR